MPKLTLEDFDSLMNGIIQRHERRATGSAFGGGLSPRPTLLQALRMRRGQPAPGGLPFIPLPELGQGMPGLRPRFPMIPLGGGQVKSSGTVPEEPKEAKGLAFLEMSPARGGQPRSARGGLRKVK